MLVKTVLVRLLTNPRLKQSAEHIIGWRFNHRTRIGSASWALKPSTIIHSLVSWEHFRKPSVENKKVHKRGGSLGHALIATGWTPGGKLHRNEDG